MIFSVDIREAFTLFDRPDETEWIQKHIRYAVGVHPCHVDLNNAEATDRLFANVCKLSFHPAVVAIGETGLDKITAKTTDDFRYQQELFISHVRLSEKVKKPLIIHCVKAWNELIQLRQSFKPAIPWIIHGFRGNETLAKQLLNADFHLSFSLLYNREALQTTWKKRRLLLETDDKKIDIRMVYQQIANDLSISVQELSQKVEENINSIILK
jgi:TatD DNase family protein